MQAYLTELKTMARVAWSWWTGELRGAIPPGLATSFAETRAEVLLRWSAETVHVLLRRGRQVDALGRLDPNGTADPAEVRALLADVPKDAPVIVALAPAQVVRQRAELPLAAETNVSGVIGFELDRLTPFSPQDVYFDCRVVARRAEAQKLDVDLYIAPRETVDAIRQTCARWGLTPLRVDTSCGPDGETAGVHLLDGPAPRPKSPLVRTVFNTLLMSVAAIAVLAAWAQLDAKQDAAAALKGRLGELRAEVAGYDALQEAAGAQAARLAAVGIKRASPLATEVLDEVTRRLPEHSWLFYYRLSGDRLTLSGSSAAAADLIGLFEASPLFFDAEFAEPIVQDPRSGRERFSLSVRLAAEEQS